MNQREKRLRRQRQRAAQKQRQAFFDMAQASDELIETFACQLRELPNSTEKASEFARLNREAIEHLRPLARVYRDLAKALTNDEVATAIK